MNFVTENITPAKAKEYLQTSWSYSQICDPAIVKNFANTMKKGKWELNGMCIIFDTDGHLIDGHHRLLAVIKAGIPVKFDVARGIELYESHESPRRVSFPHIINNQKSKEL